MQRAVEQFNGREGETATLLLNCPLNFSGLGGGFAPRHLSRSALSGEKPTAQFMGLEENCKTCLGKLVVAKPEYGWGWTRLDAPEIPVPAQINGVPFPFHCRIQRFFDFRGELRGFVGRVEQAEHIYNGLLVIIYTRVVGTFNFTDNLPHCDIQFGSDEPLGEFPEFVSGSPIVNGYGVVGATLEHIAERDRRNGVLENNTVPNNSMDVRAKQRLS